VIFLVRWPLAAVLCASLLAAPLAGRSAPNTEWAVHSWQTDDGLPNNNVTALAQTPDGYLWVADPAALARFDGVRFEKYSPAVFGLDMLDRVHGLAVSRSGGLWMAYDRGVVVYSDAHQTRVFTNGLPDLNSQALLEDDDGSVWVTFALGVVCHIKTNGAVVHFTEQDGMPDAPLSSLAKDTHGTIWFAKSRGSGQRSAQVGVYRNGRFETLLTLDKSTVRISASRSGGIWICDGPRLLSFTEAAGPIDVGNFAPGHPANPSVIYEDTTGNLWIGTSDDGIFRFNGTGFEHIETSHPHVLTLIEDREGNIWAGTFGGGLDRIRQRGVELQGPGQGLPFQSVRSLTEDTHGVIWAATDNGALANYRDGAWTTMTNTAQIATVICAAADHDGNVWLGTQNHMLYQLRDGTLKAWSTSSLKDSAVTNSFNRFSDRPVSRLVRSLLPAANGDLWIGGESPLSLQRLHDGQFETFPMPAGSRSIRAMAEDSRGNVWAGTSGGYLARAAGDTVTDETARTSGEPMSIRALCATPDGALCIGYAGQGLGYLKNGHYTRFTTADGLFDDYISQIVRDDHGWLWFGGDRGIFKVRQEELDAFAEGRASRIRSRHYGRDEGLLSLQANFDASPGGLRSRDGRVWIPMRTALALINPDHLRENLGPPPVLLRQVTVDDDVIAAYHGPLPAPDGVGQMSSGVLRLPPTHRRLGFEFTAFNLTAPDNVHFRYRLDGFDDHWIERADVDDLRAVSYPRLPAGNYRFRLTACDSDGMWNGKEATFAFIVTPFFWQTWWFQSMAIIAFTLTVIAIVRYVSFRRLHSRLQSLEHQATLDKERARIARDLHDDLGGSLTQAGLLLDMSLNNLAPGDQAADGMKKCSTLVRQVAASVDEIIWAINPHNDTTSYLVDYTSQYVVEFLHAAGVHCRVDLPDRIPSQTISPEVRHNLFLVVKEALNNIARHAGATEVHLTINADATRLNIIIEDNGRGFAKAPDSATANGLRNMRQRMEEIGGRFHLESKADTGTQVSFVYPWSRHAK